MKSLLTLLFSLVLFSTLSGQEFPTVSISHKDIDKIPVNKNVARPDDFDFTFLEQNLNSFTQQTLSCSAFTTKNRIYVFDFLKSRIHSYDISGKYLFSTNRIGKGPYEYKQIRSVFLADNERFGIWDSMLKKVILFDPVGNPVQEIKLPLDIDVLRFFEGKYYGLSMDQESYVLIVMDARGAILQKWEVARSEQCLSAKSFNCLFIYKGQICFAIQPLNKIQTIRDGKVADYLLFDFGKDQITKKSFETENPTLANREAGTVYLKSISSHGDFITLNIDDGQDKSFAIIPGVKPLLGFNFKFSFGPGCDYFLSENYKYSMGSLNFLLDGNDLSDLQTASICKSGVLSKVVSLIGNRQGIVLARIKATDYWKY